MGDLLRCAGTNGNKEELAGNAQRKRRQHPLPIRREIVAHTVANAYRRGTIASAEIKIVIGTDVAGVVHQQQLFAVV